MGLSKLSAKCRACPYADKCDHKEMEEHGCLPGPYLAGAAQPAASFADAPVLRETVTIRVDGHPAIVYRDELEKELRRGLYGGLGLLMPAT